MRTYNYRHEICAVDDYRDDNPTAVDTVTGFFCRYDKAVTAMTNVRIIIVMKYVRSMIIVTTIKRLWIP
jgi:hypothetical protein